MKTEQLVLDRDKARELWRRYRSHVHYQKPVDEEIQRVYKQLAQGHTVIRALESIKLAGLKADGLPALALVRADAKRCEVELLRDGSALFVMENTSTWRPPARRGFRLPAGTFPSRTDRAHAVAAPPLIPVHLRPQRGLANYHLLYEAEWTPLPPVDPFLLRRLGGDAWLVVAAWDLTEVERAVMATRVSA